MAVATMMGMCTYVHQAWLQYKDTFGQLCRLMRLGTQGLGYAGGVMVMRLGTHGLGYVGGAMVMRLGTQGLGYVGGVMVMRLGTQGLGYVGGAMVMRLGTQDYGSGRNRVSSWFRIGSRRALGLSSGLGSRLQNMLRGETADACLFQGLQPCLQLLVETL